MSARRLLYLILLLLPFAAVLWTPFYNRLAPGIAGIPFFYWYQLLWIPLGSALLFLLHRAGRDHTDN